MKTPWPTAPFLVAVLFAAGGFAASAGSSGSPQVPSLASANGGRGNPLPVLFYSGRNDNKDLYILHPGEREPRNLTNHPAQDLCPAASPDGKRILFLSDRGGNKDIYGMAPDGSDVRRLTATPEPESHPEFTPDGTRILFVRDFEKRTEIWIMNADGSEARRLTNNEARDERPFMSRDGSKIIFMSDRDGNYEIYTMAPDGSGQTRLTDTPEWEIFPVWSPDGTKIAYAQKFRADGRMEGMVRVMSADGSGDRAVTAVETRDENAMWSPDGRHIVLQSVRDGNFEVYQVDLDGANPVRLTDHPAWDGWACYLPVKDMPNVPSESHLGQKPPGMTPEVFAPGVVSRDGIQMKLAMSADGAEILYTERDPATNAASFILRRRKGNSWGEPVVLPYSREYMDIEPSLSPDGRSLFFTRETDIYGISTKIIEDLKPR